MVAAAKTGDGWCKMPTLKPEYNWSSGYIAVHPDLAEIERLLKLRHPNIDVQIEDKHRQFDDIHDLSEFWKNIYPPLQLVFRDRDSEYSQLSVFVDSMGTLLVGTHRTPVLVAISDEIVRVLKSIEFQRDLLRSPAPSPNEFQNDVVGLRSDYSFLSRKRDDLLLLVVGLGLTILITYLGLLG